MRQSTIYHLPPARSADLGALEDHALLADPTLPIAKFIGRPSTPVNNKAPEEKLKRTPLKGGVSLTLLSVKH